MGLPGTAPGLTAYKTVVRTNTLYARVTISKLIYTKNINQFFLQ